MSDNGNQGMVLLTGGTGFIGSHICVELSRAGRRAVLLDNLCNSKPTVVDRLAQLCGERPPFIEGDIRDRRLLAATMTLHRVTEVIHLAGLKAVGESVENPLLYWDNNLAGTLSLVQAMGDAGVRSLVFSSSCTVYGEPERLPIDETHPLRGASPYGRTKLAVEQMLRDLVRSDDRWKICLLRYFNPVGAHESGTIGEDPNGLPNNLMPYILKVASGDLPKLRVWGSDYDTKDGTGVRDYIHVMDVAEAHVRAMERLPAMRCEAVNLGTGQGSSVLEVVHAFERVNGVRVPYELMPRRPGDVQSAFADPSKAASILGWRTSRNLEDMCRDAWRWQCASSGHGG
jgi:UDP-glucose 4-epimerase